MKTFICIPSVMKMIKYELKKLYSAKALIILTTALICLYALLCAVIKPDLSKYTFDTEIYKMYISKYGGEYSQQTYNNMCAELEKQQKIAQQDLSGSSYTADEYMFLSEQITAAEHKAQALEAVIDRYMSLKSGQQLVYDLEFTEFTNGYLKKFGTLLCLISVTVITLRLSLSDYKCGMESIMFTTCSGKRNILRTKLIISMIAAAIISLLFGLCETIIIYSRDFGDISVPICSYGGFEGCKYDISLRSALYLSVIIKTIGCMMYSALLFVISRLVKNEVVSAMSLMGIYALIGQLDGTLSYINLYAIINGIYWFK